VSSTGTGSAVCRRRSRSRRRERGRKCFWIVIDPMFVTSLLVSRVVCSIYSREVINDNDIMVLEPFIEYWSLYPGMVWLNFHFFAGFGSRVFFNWKFL
jgi:hypothetical protein